MTLPGDLLRHQIGPDALYVRPHAAHDIDSECIEVSVASICVQGLLSSEDVHHLRAQLNPLYSMMEEDHNHFKEGPEGLH